MLQMGQICHQYARRLHLLHCQKCELFFTKQEVKTNSQYCLDILLSQQMSAAIKLLVDDNFVFHQHGTLHSAESNCYHAKFSVIFSQLWSHNGPELNSTDNEKVLQRH